MKAVFERAKVIVDGEDTYLCLSIPRRDAAKFVGEMKPRKYAVEIKEYRKKRSLDANAYAWTLIGKLAAVLSTKEAPVTPDNVYRDCIRDVGDNYDVIPVKEDRIEYWNRIWCAGHIGRFTEDWTDKDGNKRRNAEVLADNIYFGDAKKDADSGAKKYAGGQFVEVDEDFDADDDFPF